MNKAKRNIITIQGQVASGYVGNTAASLAIQLHMINAVQIPTVIFPNSLDYPNQYGSAVHLAMFKDLLAGLKENYFIERSDFIITGFCDNKAIISAIANFLKSTKQGSGYLYVYDPVLAHYVDGGLYCPREVVMESILKLLPLSDIITPNHFELELILNRRITTEEEFYQAILKHPILRTKTVIAKNIKFADTPQNIIETVLYEYGDVQRFKTPSISEEFAGTGDLFTAVVVSQIQVHGDIRKAIKKATDYLDELLMCSSLKGYDELNAEMLLQRAHLLF